jgi:uncharacterized protein (DUF169 family)|tara:strand:- start:62 stop:379 length:318 start_codon:yes stop_codon:yes gene_type:complete
MPKRVTKKDKQKAYVERMKKRRNIIAVSTPNMYGMPKSEKLRRAKQEKGLEVSAKKRQSKYKTASKIAFQSGATAYGYKMSAKAEAQGKKAVQHGYRKSKYAGDI